MQDDIIHDESVEDVEDNEDFPDDEGRGGLRDGKFFTEGQEELKEREGRICDLIRSRDATIFDIGLELLAIRDGRLYLSDGFDTFQEYVARKVVVRFGIGKREAENWVIAAKIRAKLPEASRNTFRGHTWALRDFLALARLAPKSDDHAQRYDYDRLDEQEVERVIDRIAGQAHEHGITSDLVKGAVNSELLRRKIDAEKAEAESESKTETKPEADVEPEPPTEPTTLPLTPPAPTTRPWPTPAPTTQPTTETKPADHVSISVESCLDDVQEWVEDFNEYDGDDWERYGQDGGRDVLDELIGEVEGLASLLRDAMNLIDSQGDGQEPADADGQTTDEPTAADAEEE
jgi:hypothetical protein